MVDERPRWSRSALPPEVRQWLERRAAAEGVTTEELVRQLVAAYQLTIDPNEPDIEMVVSGLVDERNRELEETVVEWIEDIRKRVVQLKRETDGKAPASHDHDALERRLDALEHELSRSRSITKQLSADLADVDRTVDEGFENFESVLEELLKTTDGLEERITKLTSVLVETRSTVRAIERDVADRRALDGLVDEANRHGARKAVCESCASTVDITLLRTAVCPHCDAAFAEFEPKRWLFGSHTLYTRNRPALESGAEEPFDAGAEEPFDVDDLFDRRGEESTSRGRASDGGEDR